MLQEELLHMSVDMKRIFLGNNFKLFYYAIFFKGKI